MTATLPKVSCVCPTYNRYPDFGNLVEDAVECFLRQDYGGEKELILVNDCIVQKLVCDAPGVKVFNLKRRFPTLGAKYNFAVEQASGELIFPWEDDDVSFPSRITQGVAELGGRSYWKPPQVWFWSISEFPRPVYNHPVGVRHHASVYAKTAWEGVGGYPPISGAQDSCMDAALGGARLPIYPRGLKPSEWQYLYRWGVSNCHLSGNVHADEFYRGVGRWPVSSGEFRVEPGNRLDGILELIRGVLEDARKAGESV